MKEHYVGFASWVLSSTYEKHNVENTDLYRKLGC